MNKNIFAWNSMVFKLAHGKHVQIKYIGPLAGQHTWVVCSGNKSRTIVKGVEGFWEKEDNEWKKIAQVQSVLEEPKTKSRWPQTDPGIPGIFMNLPIRKKIEEAGVKLSGWKPYMFRIKCPSYLEKELEERVNQINEAGNYLFDCLSSEKYNLNTIETLKSKVLKIFHWLKDKNADRIMLRRIGIAIALLKSAGEDMGKENNFTSKYQNLWINNNCKFAQKVTKNRIGKDKKKLQEAVNNVVKSKQVWEGLYTPVRELEEAIVPYGFSLEDFLISGESDGTKMVELKRNGIIIDDSCLVFSWYKMPSGKYEVNAYIS